MLIMILTPVQYYSIDIISILDRVANIKYRLYQVLSMSAIVLTACGHKAPILSPSPTISPSTVVPSISTPSSSPSVEATPSSSDVYKVIDEAYQPQFTAQSVNLFKSTQLPNTKIQFDALKLLAVLASTRQYFQNQFASDPDIQRHS
jgi:hypothetical protein